MTYAIFTVFAFLLGAWCERKRAKVQHAHALEQAEAKGWLEHYEAQIKLDRERRDKLGRFCKSREASK